MRESIVCIGRIAKRPYRFPETGIEVFSYEELCFYLSSHMLCYLYSLPEEELLIFIRDELGLDKLYRQLSRLTDPNRDQMKFFAALFREGNYFSEEEIREILDVYRDMKNMPYPLQCRQMGDMLLQAGRASMAVYYYKEALKRHTMDETATGAVYHNMGVACSRMFRFQEAKVNFVKAYQYAGDEESLFYFYGITAFTEGLERAGEEMQAFQLSELSLESFANRFAGISEDFLYSDARAKENKIAWLLQHDKETEAAGMYARFIRKLQKQYRPELLMEHTWPSSGMPEPQ